jgi:general secretion pathway protein C
MRFPDWLARIPRNGPWLTSLLLAALIAVELARVVVFLLGGSPVKSLQPAGTPPGDGARRSNVDLAAIIGGHLFGIATVDPGAQDPANAPPSTANLQLAGTIATQDPKKGVAIISDGGPSKVYSVGDNVGGARLHSVYLDHVILDRGGVLETLTLPRLLLAARAPTPEPATASAVANLRRMVQADPSILNEVMRTVASYDNAAGRLRGFRAYPGRNRAAFSRLGLRPGDLVTAINGTALDDPQRSQEILNTIQSSDRATVTIERAGQKQDITLNIAQVATQAAKDLESDPAAQGPGTPAPLAQPSSGPPSAPPMPGPGQPANE